MTDVLIEDVEDSDLKFLDDEAKRLGISREQILRRAIAREAHRVKPKEPLTVESFRRFRELASDMLEPDFEQRAWSCG